MRKLAPLAFVLLLCSFFFKGNEDRGLLVARSEYLESDYLASTVVGTPDMYHGCFKGQQVIITWNLPYTCCFNEMKLHLQVLYGDGTLGEMCYPISIAKGRKAYRLITDEYKKKRGIDTYRAIITHGNQYIALYEHHLWKELIEISDV